MTEENCSKCNNQLNKMSCDYGTMYCCDICKYYYHCSTETLHLWFSSTSAYDTTQYGIQRIPKVGIFSGPWNKAKKYIKMMSFT